MDTENSIAYWHHIDNATLLLLSQKIKKQTISLLFDKKNIIHKNNGNYINDWIKIIEAYQYKLYDYDLLKNRSALLDWEIKEIRKHSNTAIGKVDPIYVEIHVFLDFYNNLLDYDFLTTKNFLYPNYWKIGFGIYQYLEQSTRFILYPISYSLNDALIKQFDSQELLYSQNAISYIGFNYENPIKFRPKQYAYELIEKNTSEVLKRQPLLVKDEFLANEYILAFIDKFNLILGLENKLQEYLLFEIEYSLYVFLPLWIEQTINILEYKDRKEHNIAYPLDFIYLHTYSNDIKKISDIVKVKINNGVKPTLNIKLFSEEFSIDIIVNLISYLKQIGVDKIRREYENQNAINKSSYYIWESWGEEKTIKNIKLFYSHFPRVYDLLIASYFPNLKKELQFYNEYDLVIIVVDFSKAEINYSPSIDYYYLKSDLQIENRILIYNSNEKNIPLRRENFRDLLDVGSRIQIEGIGYIMKSCSFTVLGSFNNITPIYDKTPMLTAINSLLKDNFKEYFEKKKKKNE